MSSQTKDSARLAIVLAPRSAIGAELERFAADWIREGILTDFIWVPTSGLTADDIRQLRLNCSFASQREGRQNFDLFQYLSQVVVDHIDVIVPWVVGDEQPDDELWGIATVLRAALKEGMPNGGSGAATRSKWLYTSLVVMPTTDRALQGFEPTQGEYGEFDLNVYVSPETRSNPWAGSAPLHSGEDFELFALAQLASVAGTWAGATESLTGLLERDGYRFGQGSFIMLRTMSSMVITNGLADRLVSESLRQLTDPTKSPYEFSDPNDLNRPIARADELPLLKELIVVRRDKVLAAGGDELTYTSERKPEALDFTRDWKEAVRFFWQFTRDTVKAMPRYSLDFLQNEWSRLIGRKLNDVREAVPERFIGITVELQQMLTDIASFRGNQEAQDALVISRTADSKNPRIWSTLRTVSFGALDGSDAPTGEKPIVLPRVDYVVHDPNARFEVSAEMQAAFDLETDRIDVGEASELKSRVAAALGEENDRLDQLNAAIDKTRIALIDPYLDIEPEPEPEPEPESEPEVVDESELDGEREIDELEAQARVEHEMSEVVSESGEQDAEVAELATEAANSDAEVAAETAADTPIEEKIEAGAESSTEDEPAAGSEDETEEEPAAASTQNPLVWDDTPDAPPAVMPVAPAVPEVKKSPFKRVTRKPRKSVSDE